MTFAQKLARDSKGETATNEQLAQTIAGLYDRAATAASTPQQQVNFRIARARFARTTKDSGTELKLLQEILADPQYRAVAVVPEGEGATAPPSPAALVASRQIDELIKRDPGAYEPVEQAAAKAMEEARAANDPAKLLNVAQVYPNAKVAPEALLAAANSYEAAGNNRQAAQLLRQLYFRYPQSADKLTVIESLARNYLAMSNYVEVAAARLAQAAKLDANAKLTKPLKLPDGKVLQDMTFADALKAVRQFKDLATAKALPEIKLPPYKFVAGQEAPKPFAPADPNSAIPNVAALVAPLREFTRNDRVVTFAPTSGVSVFQVGKPEPLFSNTVLTETPANCAWVGENLLVWAGGRIALIKGDKNELVWSDGLKTISMVDVASADDAGGGGEGGDADAQIDAQQLNINGRIVAGGGQVQVLRGAGGNQVIVVQGGQRLLLRNNGQVQVIGGPGGAPQPAVAAGGPEQVWTVRIVADRAIVGTTSGRVIAIDLADGKTIWQTRLGDRVIERLVASDDFVVATVNDGNAMRLTVMDTFSGQTLQKKDFNNDGSGLVNLALSPDGKLVYVTADQLSCKDLFEPGDLSKPTFTISTRRTDGNPLFAGTIQAEQLVIADGRVLVVSDNGQFVRVYSLETGKALQPTGANGNKVDVDGGLQTKSSNWQVQLLTVGPRVYVWSPLTVISYNLDKLSDTWEPPSRKNSAFNLRDLVAAKDFLIGVYEPVGARQRQRRFGGAPGAPGAGGGPPAQNPPLLMLRTFSRATVEGGGESGLIAHEYELRDAAGITSWQVVDGGFYYLTADKKLHFLKGAAAD
jgi:outer membrane protein assembly factor BamB